MSLTQSELRALSPEIQTAHLLVWPPGLVTVPSPATLRTLVRVAVEAMDAGADKIDLFLADGCRLPPDQVRHLHSRFGASTSD